MVVDLQNQNLCTMTTLIKIDGDYAEWIRNLSLRYFKSTLPSIDDIEKVLFLQKKDER